jgi:phage baseplate assembly protein W
MEKIIYKGVTFSNYRKDKTFRLNNLELVKQDLLNHIFTRKGERVMMPDFGTRIQDLIMEPLDEFNLLKIRQDLYNVFNYDPRVKILNFQVNPLYEEKAVVAIAELKYIELDLTDILEIRLEFEN